MISPFSLLATATFFQTAVLSLSEQLAKSWGKMEGVCVQEGGGAPGLLFPLRESCFQQSLALGKFQREEFGDVCSVYRSTSDTKGANS
jgi:hypothetical protein